GVVEESAVDDGAPELGRMAVFATVDPLADIAPGCRVRMAVTVEVGGLRPAVRGEGDVDVLPVSLVADELRQVRAGEGLERTAVPVEEPVGDAHAVIGVRFVIHRRRRIGADLTTPRRIVWVEVEAGAPGEAFR